jgi:aspartate/methionine/tyrosine aminotransferase
MDIVELERAAAEAKANGQKLKALAVINPGNPTGQCLPYANMVEVVKFCEREDIVLMADEVSFQTGDGGNEASGTVHANSYSTAPSALARRAHLLQPVLAFQLLVSSGACWPRDDRCVLHSNTRCLPQVYQQNVYGGYCDAMSRHRDPAEVEAEHKFTSFRRVIKQQKSKCQLMSFHSVSKGVVGECGRRGGYLELMNIDPEVEEQILKLFSIGLCSNIAGQIMVGCMVNPPKPGDASYVQFVKV